MLLLYFIFKFFSCSENGCLFNCDKCGSKCVICDCSTSTACKYNCDKCDETINDTHNESEDAQENKKDDGINSVQEKPNNFQASNNVYDQDVDVETLTKECEGLKEAGDKL